MDTNNFELKVQAVLDKVKSLANFRRNLKEIEPKLPKLKIQGTLNTTSTRKELNSKLKSIKPKVKVDADTTQAEKKIKKIGKQKTNTTITPTVNTTQVEAGLKKAQKETKTLWERFAANIIGSNLIRMGTQKVIQAIHEAFRSLKELDTIKTNIQMVSGTTNSEVNSMMQSYNAMAKELSSTTKEVGEAANEFLRMGESIASTNELIKNATILSKVGMIDSADAAGYLISSMKGYQVSAEDSIDIVSKLTAVDLEAAVSAGGLAEAISRCSNLANNSGTSMDRLIGYAAAIGEVTRESMSVVGNSLNSMYSRMNNIKIGRFIDDETGESLSDTEAVLNKLGIQLRDTEDTYRNFDDVLDDVGKNWKDFTQIEQNAISAAIAGTMQKERFTALMNNYSSALEYSEVAANSAGSALERYGVYQNSIEAKTNELTAAIESLSTNIVSEELYSGIIQATTGLVEFLDKTNLLKTSLAGLVAMGISKAIVSIGTGFIIAAKSSAQLAAAMALFGDGMGVSNLEKIGRACIGLNGKQLKLILSTKGLEYEQQKQILLSKGVAKTEVEATLATLGFAKSEDKATLSTLGLGTAFKGLGISIKNAIRAMLVWMATNPVGWVTTAIAGIGTAVYGVVKLHDALTVSLEEQKEKLQETRETYEDVKKELQDVEDEFQYTKNKIEELENISNPSWVEQEELDRLREVTKELELQKQLKQDMLLEAAEDFYKENEKTFNKEFESSYGNTSVSDLKQQLSSGNIGIGQLDYENITDIVSALQYITEEKAKVTDESEIAEYDKFIKDLTDAVKNNGQQYLASISEYKENILEIASIRDLTEDEQEFYDYLSSMQKMIYEFYSPATWNNLKFDSVFNTKGIEKTKDELIGMYKSGELTSADMLEQFPKLNQAIKESGIIAGEGSNVFKEFFNEIAALAEQTEDMVSGVAGKAKDSLSITDTIGQLNTRLKPAFDALASAWKDIFTDDEFALSSIDILSTCDSIKSKLDGMKELGVKVDYSSYEDFVRVLQNSESTEQNVKDAFDSLAASITSAGLSGAEDFETLKAALEDLGVVNDELVAFEALISNTEALTEAGIDLAGATEEQISEFANEMVSAENVSQAIAMLTFQKELYNMQMMNTAGEVANLRTLAENAGYTGDVIKYLTELEQIYQEVARGTINPINIGAKIARAALLQALIKESAGKINYDPKVDFSNVGGGKKSASKAGKEAVDAYLEAFEKELKDLDDLKDSGKITEKQYLDALRRLYLKYFNQKKKYLKEYEKYEHQYLEGMKSLYESAFSYITKQIDKRMDAINAEKDAAVSALEAERDARLEEIEARKEQYEIEIEGIEKEISAREKEIESMQDANEERKRSLDLQKAEYEFQRMQNQRTDFVYKGGQMSYQADTSGIRDAKQEVDDIKLEIDISKIETEISFLEAEKELRQDKIDLLDKEAEKINKYYDDLISKEEQRFDAMIKGMEDYKSQFEELTELFENAQMEAVLSELGINMDALLSGSQEEFEKLKTAYIGILADMSRGNNEIIGQLSRLAGVNAESVSYLESTKGAFENLGAVTLEGLENSVDGVGESMAGLTTSAGEASAAMGGVQGSIDGTSKSIAPLNEELEKLNKLITTLTTLLNGIEFPEPGDEGYAQKLKDIALAFGVIAVKCAEFQNIDFSSIIGTGSTTTAGNGDPLSGGSVSDTQGQPGTGFMGLVSAISEAVETISGQMDNLRLALQVGNDAFEDQINKIQEEYLPAWEELQTRLAEIIGVGGGEGDGKGDGKQKSGGKDGGSESGGNGSSIIDIMQTGGDEVAARLEDPWLKAFNDFATDGDNSIQSICDKIIEMVKKMADTIQEQCAAAANALNALAETADASLFSVDGSIPGKTKTVSVTPYAEGTVGKAFAKAKEYKGLPHDGKYALRSEYGQPELTVYPDGKAELTTEPTMGALPKGTVIFNGEQTERIMHSKGEVVRTYENGNVGLADGSIVRPNGDVLRPLTPNDSAYQMLKKFEEYFNVNRDAFMKPAYAMNNAAEALNKAMETINNNSTMNRNMNVDVGGIHVHGVQNPEDFSDIVAMRAHNRILQEMKKY